MSDFYWLNPFFEAAKPEPILREAFAWEDNGIFAALQASAEASSIELPWDGEDAETLDLAYFGNHSGGKFCAPVVKLFLQTESMVDEDGRINSTGARKLADILLRKYLTNWKRLWETNIVSYSPINNYDMTEIRELVKSDTETEEENKTGVTVGEEKTKYGKSQTTNHGRTTDSLTYKYGINTNTNDPKPSEKENTEEGGTTGVVDSGTDSTEMNRVNTDLNSRDKVNAGTESETTHRIGNIGVTTNQKLIQEERNLWLWNYFEQIFSDLDRELALAFHDPCRV